MSVETTTSTSSSGSTTTVGATVRESSGGPGEPRVVDVYLLIEPAKMWFDPAYPPSPEHTAHDEVKLAVYWKELAFTEKAPLELKYHLHRKPTEEFEGSVEGTLIVCDRKNDVLWVKRFSLCPERPKPKVPSAWIKGTALTKTKKKAKKKAKSKSLRGKSRAR